MTKRKMRRAARDGRRAVATGTGMLRAAGAFGEMAEAACRTIDARNTLMRRALEDPIGGDYAEFRRMGQEKVEAASAGALAGLAGWHALGGELANLWQRQMLAGLAAGTQVARCRTPAAALKVQADFAQAAMERAASSALRLTQLGTRALESGLRPYHGRATRNARRLERASRRK